MTITADAPVAERNAYNALLKAGVNVNEIFEVLHCTLADCYTIRVAMQNKDRVNYIISRNFEVIAKEQIFVRGKSVKRNDGEYKSAAYRRAEAFFSV